MMLDISWKGGTSEVLYAIAIGSGDLETDQHLHG